MYRTHIHTEDSLLCPSPAPTSTPDRAENNACSNQSAYGILAGKQVSIKSIPQVHLLHGVKFLWTCSPTPAPTLFIVFSPRWSWLAKEINGLTGHNTPGQSLWLPPCWKSNSWYFRVVNGFWLCFLLSPSPKTLLRCKIVTSPSPISSQCTFRWNSERLGMPPHNNFLCLFCFFLVHTKPIQQVRGRQM